MTELLSPPLTSSDVPVEPGQIRIPLDSFVTSAGKINERVLMRQLQDLDLSSECTCLFTGFTDVAIVRLQGVPSPADVAAVYEVAEAHEGVPFSATQQEFVDERTVSTPSSVRVETLAANTGVLPEGSYQIAWYAEVRVTEEGQGTLGLVTLDCSKNDSPLEGLAQTCATTSEWVSFSGQLTKKLRDGDKLRLELAVQRPTRQGHTPLTSSAEARRSRVFLRRI